MSRIQVEERYYNAFGRSLELSRDKSKTGSTLINTKPNQTIIKPRGVRDLQYNKEKEHVK